MGTEWSSFPPQFTRGLEATLHRGTTQEAQGSSQGRWDEAQDSGKLEREARLRGISTKCTLQELLHRLCHFDMYWGEQLVHSADEAPTASPDPEPDPELDGEALDKDELALISKEAQVPQTFAFK